MKIEFNGNSLKVIKEATDKKYYGTANGAGEANFLYDLKNELNKKGFDLIKKRMWKDGHLVDDLQQYLKTRKAIKGIPHIYIYSNFFAIRGLNDDFNEGKVELSIEFDVYNKNQNSKKLINQLLN